MNEIHCKRNALPNTTDDRLLEIALLALASFKGCCSDGKNPSAPHEDDCAVASANHWLEYHAGILSRPPRANIRPRCPTCGGPITYSRYGESGGWCGRHGPLGSDT